MARGSQWGHGNCEFCVCFMCCSLQRQKFAVVRHERQQKNPPWLVEARARGVANAWIIFVVLIYPSLQPQRDEFAAVVREKQSWFRDRMCICRTAHTQSDKCRLVMAAPRHPANVSGQNWPSRRVTLSDVKKSRGKRRYSRVCASTSRVSLCQNVKVTHIRNSRNIRVYDNNCTQRRQKIAHIFSKNKRHGVLMSRSPHTTGLVW